jgi:hypothetical protein
MKHFIRSDKRVNDVADILEISSMPSNHLSNKFNFSQIRTSTLKFEQFTINVNLTNYPNYEYLKLCNFNSSLKTCLLVPIQVGKGKLYFVNSSAIFFKLSNLNIRNIF